MRPRTFLLIAMLSAVIRLLLDEWAEPDAVELELVLVPSRPRDADPDGVPLGADATPSPTSEES